MNSDAALDALAFQVGLRLIGPDERRRLRIALGRDPAMAGAPGFDVDAVERLDALLDGRRPAETLQDRVDLKRARRERAEPPFSLAFWAMRARDLTRSGFPAEQANLIVAEVRKRVEAINITAKGDKYVGQLEET